MPSKCRSDFAKAAIKVAGATLVAAFMIADTAAALEAQREPIQKLTQPADPAPNRPGEEKPGAITLVRKFAELVASARDDRDRVTAIADAISVQKSQTGASHRIAPTRG